MLWSVGARSLPCSIYQSTVAVFACCTFTSPVFNMKQAAGLLQAQKHGDLQVFALVKLVMTRARQAVFGSPGTLGWVPGREDAVVLWRMIGGALLALTPWTYSLKVRAARWVLPS